MQVLEDSPGTGRRRSVHTRHNRTGESCDFEMRYFFVICRKKTKKRKREGILWDEFGDLWRCVDWKCIAAVVRKQ